MCIHCGNAFLMAEGHNRRRLFVVLTLTGRRDCIILPKVSTPNDMLLSQTNGKVSGAMW